jgi:IS30 family transposase
MRRSRHHTQKTADHGRISDTVSIRERPAEAEDRAVPGHWEGALLFGSKNSQIATQVERHTRYVMLAKVKSKNTETVIHKVPGNAVPTRTRMACSGSTSRREWIYRTFTRTG